MSIKTLLLIGCGSFVGGILRYVVARLIQSCTASTLPWGTLVVNILGCLLLGALSAALTRHYELPEEWRLALMVGLCGGFTTFSSFAHENLLLLHQGAWLHALAYSTASFILCMIAVILGYHVIIK